MPSIREMMLKLPIEPHHEVPEVFIDGIGQMLLDGNTLRIDFTVARWNDVKPPAQPTGARHIVARLALTGPCAVDLINRMQQIAAQMSAAGMITIEGGQAKPDPKLN